MKGPKGPESFSLINDGVSAHQTFIDIVCSEKTIKNYVGLKSIEKLLENVLRKYFHDRARIIDTEVTQLLKEKITELRNSVVEWEGFVPTAFLIFSDFKSLLIGKAELMTGPDSARLFIRELGARIDLNKNDEAEKAGLKTVLGEFIAPQLNHSPVVAKVIVKAESSKVWALVEEEAETSLDLLRCYTSVLYPQDIRVGIGLMHQCGFYHRPVIGFSRNDPSWTIDSQNVGIQSNFELTNAKIDHLRDHFAFDRLSEIIGKEQYQLTKLEELIVNTVRWLGRGVMEHDYAKKVLHFAAASETLIMGQKSEGEITEKFSRRIAFLIGSTPEDRRYLTRRSKHLYSQRSKVIHSGNTNIEPSDVHGLEAITLRALVEMAKKSSSWTSHNDFVEWFEDEVADVRPTN